MAASRPAAKSKPKSAATRTKPASSRTSKKARPSAATHAGDQLRTPRFSFTGNRSLLLALVIVAVALAAGGAAIVHHHQTVEQDRKTATLNADKASFARLEQDMQTAYANIVSKVGEPSSHDIDLGCGRPDLKYTQGPIFCNVDLNFSYEVSNSESNEKRAAIALAISNAGFYAVNSNDSEGKAETTISELQFRRGQFNCRLLWFSDHTNEHSPEQFKFRCGDEVADPVYPLAQ